MIQLCFTLHCLHASLTDLPAEPEGQAQAPEEPGPGQAQAVAETKLELGPLGSESESEHEQQQPQHNPKVPSYYVSCDLHTYQDEAGRTRHCSKQMQVNQPSESICLLRLRWWVLQGTIAVVSRIKRNSSKFFRRRFSHE